MEAKKYVNWITAKRINWQYWEFFNISINLEKIKEFANEKGFVNLTMSKRKEPSKYGETETFILNEFKPQEKKEEEISIEDIPFR